MPELTFTDVQGARCSTTFT